MYNTVTQIVAREQLAAQVEYVTDIDEILSYGVLSTPALVINEKIVMLGYRGVRKIEQALRECKPDVNRPSASRLGPFLLVNLQLSIQRWVNQEAGITRI
jgi:predicted DsbA family dithiol-disulfide isomerase